jgi:hypothetical protein
MRVVIRVQGSSEVSCKNPSFPTVWLFGSDLLGLVGMARHKNST